MSKRRPGGAAGAPEPDALDGNHPGFPLYCSGGPLPTRGVDGLGVVVNGGSRGALTTDNGNKARDLGLDTRTAIDQVEAHWDVAVCSTIEPLPGEELMKLYPNGGF